MTGIRTFVLLISITTCFNITNAQQPGYQLYIHFNEWMDTTGFGNPANFNWTGGLQTLNVQLVDTAKALLTVSQPEVNIWYTLTVSNVYDISGNLICSDSDTTGCLWKSLPLPVELSSFTAKLVDDEVKLKWITETEVNNYGFEVERKVNQDGWNKIGFVEGHGNSNSQKTYTFIDNHLFGGSKFYYRLKQIDTDGQYEYSDVIEIENIPQTFALFQNYPNPFNPLTKIRYQLPVTAKVEIKIFDLTGAEVITLLNEDKDAGVHEIEFNGQDGISTQGGYASGVYFYRIQAVSSNHQTFAETKKMILIK
jgi:hypothetical protein